MGEFHPSARVSLIKFSVFPVTYLQAVIDVESDLPETSAIIDVTVDRFWRNTMQMASDGESCRVIHRCGKDCGQPPQTPPVDKKFSIGWRI
jgi:hypothetical protein